VWVSAKFLGVCEIFGFLRPGRAVRRVDCEGARVWVSAKFGVCEILEAYDSLSINDLVFSDMGSILPAPMYISHY
jgi:hypothetical protein